MTERTPLPEQGLRILGVGVHETIAETAQDAMREAGLRADVIAVTDDDAGDDRLRVALHAAGYDAVTIGAGLSGQAPPEFGASATSTAWFTRVLNIVHAEAPTTRIVLPRGPDDVLPAIRGVLGDEVPGPV